MNNPYERRGQRYDDAETVILPSYDEAPTEQFAAVGHTPVPPRVPPRPRHYIDDDAPPPLYRDEPARARHGDDGTGGNEPPKKKMGKGLKIFLWVVASLLVLTLAAIGVFYAMMRQGLSQVQRADLMPVSTKPPAPITGPLNILILGLDGRDPGEPDRSDTMILAHISADHKKTYLISIPRDSWVALPNGTYGKINAANQIGGTKGAVQVVESTLKTHVDTVVTINFEGFMMVTEALGGVTVDNPIASYEPVGNFDFPKGKITVRGKQALAFVRQRKNLTNGDFDRTLRQRLVIRAIMDQVLSAGTFSNPVKMNQLIQQMAKAITLDKKTMPDDKIQALATSMRMRSGKDMESIMATSAGFGTTSMGESIVILDEDRLAELQTALKEDKLAAYVAKYKDEPPVSGNMPTPNFREGNVVKSKR